MKAYKNILVALDFHSKSDKALLEKANLVAAKSSKIIVLHAIEELSGMVTAAYAVAGVAEIEDQLIKEAKARLTKIAKTAKIPAKQQVLKIGIARSIILDQAKKLKADLIIVGSHGRHGVKTLLGSTANAILHNAACDVLAVRVK